MEISKWNIQDWGAAIGALIAIGGVLIGCLKVIRELAIWIKSKYKPQAANMRANFFKHGNGWRIRIYNGSDTDINAENIHVIIPKIEGLHARWDDLKSFPCLKRHGSFDILVLLCTCAPDFIPITIKWVQGKKEFSVSETLQLRS